MRKNRNRLNYQTFRDQFFEAGCFNINQVYTWKPGFDKNNISRWIKKGLLIKLRNSFYAFPEFLKVPNFSLYVANYIYKPSYISLHTALAFYGMIPESVVQISSITSLKTSNFTNSFGTFSYKNILPQCMFGYDAKPFNDGKTILMATPEKAILDLLYLYPFYNSINELRALRLDEDFLSHELNIELLNSYTEKFQNKALNKRVHIFRKTYSI